MKKPRNCAGCGKTPLAKDEVSASRKFLGEGNCYCLQCLAEITGFEPADLKQRIAQLKQEGCQYFK